MSCKVLKSFKQQCPSISFLPFRLPLSFLSLSSPFLPFNFPYPFPLSSFFHLFLSLPRSHSQIPRSFTPSTSHPPRDSLMSIFRQFVTQSGGRSKGALDDHAYWTWSTRFVHYDHPQLLLTTPTLRLKVTVTHLAISKFR